MRRRAATETRRSSVDNCNCLSHDELNVVLSALWVWRAQLGRVGSKPAIPGLATPDVRKRVDEIARKLGGDPDEHFFGHHPLKSQ